MSNDRIKEKYWINANQDEDTWSEQSNPSELATVLILMSVEREVIEVEKSIQSSLFKRGFCGVVCLFY